MLLSLGVAFRRGAITLAVTTAVAIQTDHHHAKGQARRAWLRRWLWLGAALAVVLTASGCGGNGQPPAKVTPPGGPPRVVALAPAIAVILRDMGHGALIVGRHGFDAWTDSSIPSCGDQSGVDAEALVRVRPTHVYLQWGQRELPPGLTALAARDGWVVRSLPALTLSDIERMCTTLHSDLASRVGAAPAVAAQPTAFSDTPLGKRLASAFAPHQGRFSAAGRVLLLHGVSPITVIGPGSYHHELLERCGGTPALTSGTPFMTLDKEDLARLKPDAIIWLSAKPLADVLAALTELHIDIPAIRDQGVGLASIGNELNLVPGTNLIGLAEDMERCLANWSAARGGQPVEHSEPAGPARGSR